jgi:putative addiction module killer protein
MTVTHVLPLVVVEIREYLGKNGRSPFGKWFESLDSAAAAKVTVAVVRLEQGNFSNAKGVGSGVYECRIDFGPGYRVYFGKDGAALVILLGGGTKKRQSMDIQTATEYWKNYKQGKTQER